MRRKAEQTVKAKQDKILAAKEIEAKKAIADAGVLQDNKAPPQNIPSFQNAGPGGKNLNDIKPMQDSVPNNELNRQKHDVDDNPAPANPGNDQEKETEMVKPQKVVVRIPERENNAEQDLQTDDEENNFNRGNENQQYQGEQNSNNQNSFQVINDRNSRVDNQQDSIGGMQLQWDWDDFSIMFKNYGGAEQKVRRAPHPTTGEPWPMPQYYAKKDKKVCFLFYRDVKKN